MKKILKVLLLVDLTAPASAEDFEKQLEGPDWQTEIDVLTTLRSLGHEVRVAGLFNDIGPVLKMIQEDRPDIVFNLAEHFNNNTSLERDIVGLLELLGLSYTGSGPTGLMLCKNKALMKKLMTFHKIKTPHFAVMVQNKPIHKPKSLKYPLIVKPTKEDASYGISQASFVETDEALIERVKFVHEKMSQNALIEEYVEGRELYVGLMGNNRLTVFTPRELVFKEVPEGEPKIATFRAKWDQEYKEKWGIQSRFANPMAEGVLDKIFKVAKRVYHILQIQGYGRIDLRLTPNNEIMILEANPNPGISKEEDLTLSAEKDGLPYDQFIQKILQLGLNDFSLPEP